MFVCSSSTEKEHWWPKCRTRAWPSLRQKRAILTIGSSSRLVRSASCQLPRRKGHSKSPSRNLRHPGADVGEGSTERFDKTLECWVLLRVCCVGRARNREPQASLGCCSTIAHLHLPRYLPSLTGSPRKSRRAVSKPMARGAWPCTRRRAAPGWSHMGRAHHRGT